MLDFFECLDLLLVSLFFSFLVSFLGHFEYINCRLFGPLLHINLVALFEVALGAPEELGEHSVAETYVEQLFTVFDRDSTLTELLNHLSNHLSDAFGHLFFHGVVDLIVGLLLLNLVLFHGSFLFHV